MAKKRYSCDFETTTDPLDCRVWAYGWMEIGNTKNYKIGNSLEEFMEWLSICDGIIYFHNLRFDGKFIVNWLLKNGYTYSNSGAPYTFHCTISNMGQWYVIEISYGYVKNKKKSVTIYDSLKKLPFPVKKIAKDFKLPMLKGEIDYDEFRPVGHQITEKEYQYIKNDIEIIAMALDIQLTQGLKKITNGTDSLSGFKSSIGTKQFEKHFPILTLEVDEEIRKAYRGGWTFLKKEYASKVVGEGIVFDVNSLYPAQMYSRELPIGIPKTFKGKYVQDDEYPLYIQALKCNFELKEGYLPTIQIKKSSSFIATEYLETSNNEHPLLYLTNIDLELLFEHYIVTDIEYINGFKFRSKTGLFKKFIDYWTYIKTHETGAKKLLAKLMLNSLYGKFASNPKVTGKHPYLKPDGSCGYSLPYLRDLEGNIVLDENGKKVVLDEFKNPVYTPMGVFITSWARYTTITAGQKCYDRFIYADTDSLHLLGTEIPEVIAHIIDDKKLGYWAHETTFKRAKFIRQKTYIEDECKKYKRDENGNIVKDEDGKDIIINAGLDDMEFTKLSVKCAGMPDKVKSKVTFENFKIGFISEKGKLVPKDVPGGVVLVDTPFMIKP